MSEFISLAELKALPRSPACAVKANIQRQANYLKVLEVEAGDKLDSGIYSETDYLDAVNEFETFCAEAIKHGLNYKDLPPF